MERINHEYYVSLEVAKLLEKAGFDWEVEYIYNFGKLIRSGAYHSSLSTQNYERI